MVARSWALCTVVAAAAGGGGGATSMGQGAVTAPMIQARAVVGPTALLDVPRDSIS